MCQLEMKVAAFVGDANMGAGQITLGLLAIM